MKLRRAAIAVGVSAAMVVVIATLVPRIYLANDDIALTEMLRKNVFTPWISPLLAHLLGFAYQQAPAVPWYGLYQYLVIIATGAVLIHISIELTDHGPELGRITTRIAAILICASHAVLASHITWTAVSISAIGTAAAAFVAHVQLCQAAGTPASRRRALVYGLVLVAGFALRPDGIAASAVALLPMLGWAALRSARLRQLPRIGAILALVAPLVLVVAIQGRIAPARGGETHDYAEFNLQRGQLSDRAAFTELDVRAPRLLARAGWTADEYRDFMRWRLIDEHDYPLAKLKRLLDTGGAPPAITWSWSKRQLRGIAVDAAPTVSLFITLLVMCVVLAGLGTIQRWRGLAWSLACLGFLIGVPLWMSAHYRFPQRLSLSFYSVAALGVFVFLARQIADRRSGLEPARRDRVRTPLAVLVIALFAFGWARDFIAALDQAPWRYREELQALEDRIAARKAFVFVYIQIGLAEVDPLRAEPRSYDGLQGGWATFSAAWYDSIARLGVHRGAEVLGAMVDNPAAYVVTTWDGRFELEEWIQRKVGNPAIRLAVVDAAALPTSDRPTLYRVVTHPMKQGDAEWLVQQHEEWRLNDAFPGPPDVTGLAFRTVAFAAPYEQYLAPTRFPTRGTVAAAAGGLRGETASDPRATCTAAGDDGAFVGIHVPVHGLRAARFDVALIEPENIVALTVYARTPSSKFTRWRWDLDPNARTFGFTGSFTVVPGYSAHRLQLVIDTARPSDIRDLDVVVTVKPGTHAGIELRNVEVAEP